MPLHTPPPPQFLVPWCIHSTNIYSLPVSWALSLLSWVQILASPFLVWPWAVT